MESTQICIDAGTLISNAADYGTVGKDVVFAAFIGGAVLNILGMVITVSFQCFSFTTPSRKRSQSRLARKAWVFARRCVFG